MRLARRRQRANTLVLAYHNIVPRGEAARGDTSLHLAQAAFADQLDLLAETHDVIALAALGSERDSNRPAAVITFDDAYSGAVTAGVEELRKRGLPATIFVTPGLLGRDSFWWDAVAGAGGLAADVRDHALTQLAGKDDLVRNWARSQGAAIAQVPDHQRPATEAMLSPLVSGDLVSLAAHTWTHPNLARLEAVELEAELVKPLDWLRKKAAGFLPWITYPYGLASAAVIEAAARAGYHGGFLISGGWLRGSAGSQPFALPRFNVPSGLSLRGFNIRLAGFLTGG